MRIISGRFKGKKLLLPKDKNTRPLKDLVKESIFNLLNHSKKINVNLKGSTILDLFSGCGSFGIECLSRESGCVYFFENYFEAIKVLEKKGCTIGRAIETSFCNRVSMSFCVESSSGVCKYNAMQVG